MADQSKRERREAAREARRIAQEEAAKAAAKERNKSIVISILSIGLIGGLVWLAFDNVRGDKVEAAILIDREAEDAVFNAAGCEVLAEDMPNEGAAEHIDPAVAPPADAMYPFDIRPAHSGPHYPATLPIVRAGASNQLEERAIVHNYEHGAVAFWYDPAQVDGGAISAMENLSGTLNDSGFAISRGGAGIFVSPYTQPGISSGKAVALRAWGQAVDCDSFSVDAAQHFVRKHYGTEGIAPEGSFAPYAFDVLAYEDEAANTETDAPTGDAPSPDTSDPEAGETETTPEESITLPPEEPEPADTGPDDTGPDDTGPDDPGPADPGPADSAEPSESDPTASES